jgi:hypothetical protein
MTVKAQNDYCGITKWNDAGITGKGVTIWNMENGKATHGKKTTQRVLHSAPDATVINGSLNAITSNKEIKEVSVTTDEGTKYEVEEFIQKFNIKLITRSQSGGRGKAELWSQFWKPLKEKYNLIFFNSAGNEGEDGIDVGLPADIAILVAACHLSNGKPTRDWWYSSVGEEVDFIDFRGEWNGTSFASPYLCGKAALLVQKYGQQITQDEVYEYFKTHAEDLEEEGVDAKSGWGLPIMGDPKTVITIKIGSNVMDVDGRRILLDQPAVIDKTTNRTLVPIRAISEALGAEVGWDDKTKTVTIVR